MSTDIIRFRLDGSKTKSVLQWKALQIYLAISLPLVLVTCLLSYAYYRWETREDRKASESPSVRRKDATSIVKLCKWFRLKCSAIFSLLAARFNSRQQASQV